VGNGTREIIKRKYKRGKLDKGRKELDEAEIRCEENGIR
jgi:hypothetical protein